jgi:pyruvate/2-oxoglutarate dehydrogenase complex dihydrolipoamide dehydrogenase (E3) component
MDGHDAALRDHVRPPAWTAPSPLPAYDLVVLGGGTAGLVCAMGAAALGAKVAVVERHRLGGDCLNSGCVPSKALIRSARAAGEARWSSPVGVIADGVRIEFDTVMARLRARRATLAAHDAAARLASAGVHVFFGDGRFADRRSVVVEGVRLRFARAVIATGARPAVPPVPGLGTVPYLTNETVFELREQPRRLVILGAGPIGCELAQAFSRLGSVVTLLDVSDRVLPNDDPAASAVIAHCLRREGVHVGLGARADEVRAAGDGLLVSVGGRQVAGDAVLVATGRVPNVETLNLDAAGVRAHERGVVVNDRLQTSNRRIFASGDVCSRYRFTHAADAMSRLVLRNALFFGRGRASRLVIPWVTYTSPEAAHVGVTHDEVAASDGRLATITIPLVHVDRAVVDDETDGFVAVHHERGRIRGCTMVAAHAGEMIAEAVYALTHGGTLAALSATVHPYPTQAEALRKAGDEYRRQALTPGVRRLLSRYFEWTR